MKNMKTLAVTAAVAGISIVLAACGSSDDSSTSSDSGSSSSAMDVNCVDGSIQAAGSSAQANAITEWVTAYQIACPESTIDYHTSL